MDLQELQKGDRVFAATRIVNDGSVPVVPADFVFAEPGTRGMVVNMGYLEDNPEQALFLVAFEDAKGELGPPVGCMPEEIAIEAVSP